MLDNEVQVASGWAEWGQFVLKELERLNRHNDSADQTIGRIDTMVALIDERIKTIEKKVDVASAKIDELSEKLITLENQVAPIDPNSPQAKIFGMEKKTIGALAVWSVLLPILLYLGHLIIQHIGL